MSNLATMIGYHVFWKVPPVTLPDGSVMAPGTRGPIAKAGKPLVVPTTVDLKQALTDAELPAGDWLLVPVDRKGRRVHARPPVEVHVPRSAASFDLGEVIASAGKLLLEKLGAQPALVAVWESLSTDEQEAIVAQARDGVTAETVVIDRDRPVRARTVSDVVARFVDVALEVVRRCAAIRVMDPPRVALCRVAVASLAAQPHACTEERIRASVERGDYEDGAARAVARVAAGQSLQADTMASLLPGVDDPVVLLGLIGLASGETWWSLIELADPPRFARPPAGDGTLLASLFAAWRLGPKVAARPHLVRHLRGIARRRHVAGLDAVLVVLAREIDEPALSEVAGWAREEVGRDRLDLFERSLSVTVADLIRQLPRLPPNRFKVTPKVDNDQMPGAPCLCGSGRSFGECCQSRSVGTRPYPVTDVVWDTWLAQGGPGLPPADVPRLAISDLARIDLDQAGPPVLDALSVRFADLQRFDLADRCVDAIRGRQGWTEEAEDSWRVPLIASAMYRGHFDAARHQMAKLHDLHLLGRYRLGLAIIDDRPYALSVLANQVAKAIDDPRELVRLANVTLPVSPALGILLARAALRVDQAESAVSLLATIERAREQLGLPPNDVAGSQWNLLVRGESADRAINEAADNEQERSRLRIDLEDQRAEVERLTARVIALEAAAAQHAADAAQTERRAAGFEEERRVARTKSETLKTIIDEGNAERAELRRQLADALRAAEPSELSPERSDRDAASDDEGDSVDDLPAGRLRVPRFERDAEAALRSIPPLVAAEALRTVGVLGAGDPIPWRAIKQAKGMASPIYMARLGIHHRLLFRLDDGVLVVVDIVTRESLLGTLKRLRARSRPR